MSEEKYVSDEVFRSEIRRIEREVGNAVERMELKMDLYTARVDNMLTRMDGRINNLESRIDGIRDFIGWMIGLATIIIPVGTVIIQHLMK